MPKFRITAPDGKSYEVNAPDGASQQDVLAYAQAHYQQPDAAPKVWQPVKRTPQDITDNAEAYSLQHPVTDDMNLRQQFAAGLGKSMYDTARGVGQLVSGDTEASKADASRVQRQDEALTGHAAGAIGNVVGQVGQMAVPVGDLAKGLSFAGKAAPYVASAARSGVIAGLQPVQQGQTRAGNAAEGAAYGALGEGVSKVAGRVAAGAKDKIAPEVAVLFQKAKAAGIPVHFSQLSDSKFVKTLASTLSYLPFSGGAAKAQAQQQAFNAAVGRGFGAKDAKVLTDEVMATAKQNLGNAYDQLFAGRTIGLDRQAVTDLIRLHSTVDRDLESSGAKVAKNQIVRILDEAGAQGAMPGKVYQNLRSELRNQFGKETPVGRVVMQARKILDDAAARDLGPAEAATLKKLNAAYANFGTAKDALKQVEGAKGNVRPASLYPLVRNGSTKEMRDLAKIGQMLKDPIPDSGTAGRLLTTGLVGGTAMGGGLPGLLALAKLSAVGATAGRAANSSAAGKYLVEGGGRTLNGLARLAKTAPFVIPATAAAEKKKRP